jgi:sialate O-acetylesterase
VGTTAGPDGRWIAVLAPLSANPLGADLLVAGKESVTVHDLLVGEVWLCAGGADMESVAPEDASAHFPLIRHFKVERQAATAPISTASGEWKACSPATVGQFTAVGYFFARELLSRLDVPIGIINSSASGSSLEAWMSPAALGAIGATGRQALSFTPGQDGPWAPASLFNGMIHPLLPYAIRGVIWYQGEGDVGRPADYAVRFPALITAWRSHFGEGDFPFFWVQLAGPRSPSGGAADAWARLREAQAGALALPATGQAVAIDVGETERREVGRRLALIAKATVYSIPVDYVGPTFGGSSVEAGAIRVHFDFAGDGLTASGKPPQSFEIAGADRVFHAAGAVIHGDSVIVRSPVVGQPVAVRYAWRNAAEANLYNGAGLPAAPFRSDDW